VDERVEGTIYMKRLPGGFARVYYGRINGWVEGKLDSIDWTKKIDSA